MAILAQLRDMQDDVGARVVFINSFMFFMLSVLIYAINIESLLYILSVNIIFAAGSFFSFMVLVNNGYVLAPITWYILGSGIYFGLGVIAGGMHVTEWSKLIYGNSTEHLIVVNLLNSFSVMMVVMLSLLVIKYKQSTVVKSTSNLSFEFLVRLYPYLLAGSVIILMLRYAYFPMAEELVLRSILDKVYFLIPSFFLLFGMLMKRMSMTVLSISALVMLLYVVNGVLLLNKYQIITPLLAAVVGLFIGNRSYKHIVLYMFILAVVFFQLNPLVSIGREHQDYDPAVNNLNDRYAILVDTLEAIGDKDQEDHELQNPNDNFHKHIDISGRYAWIERVRALGARFDVATIQGYLIKEYNEARPGETMKDILYILIPRILWPDKPIMTSHGNKLSVQFFKNEGMRTSSTAPTYTGEAYWNYGIVGVIVVSVYIGVIFGVLSFMGLHAVNNGNISYLLIAYPVLATAIFVESWIASTYVGGLVTVLVIYYLIRSVIIVLEKRCLNVSVCE